MSWRLCCELLENFALCSGVLFWNLNTGTVISLKTKNFWLIGQVSDNRGNSWQMDTKRTFKNIQDIYMRTPMPKYKVAFEIALWYGCKFTAYFQNIFVRTPVEGCLTCKRFAIEEVLLFFLFNRSLVLAIRKQYVRLTHLMNPHTKGYYKENKDQFRRLLNHHWAKNEVFY